jgi:hypothetical protein
MIKDPTGKYCEYVGDKCYGTECVYYREIVEYIDQERHVSPVCKLHVDINFPGLLED